MTKPSFLQHLKGFFLNRDSEEPSAASTAPQALSVHRDATLPREQESRIDDVLANLRNKVSMDLRLPDKEWIQQSGPFKSVESFFNLSFQSLEDLLRHTNINPSSEVLDYGCGLGRLAIPLSEYLQPPKGRYLGVDTNAKCIERNRQAFAEFDNIAFKHVDLFSTMYNKGGKAFATLADEDFGGPYDLAFLFSVFTHILPQDCDLLLDVLRRHIRPGGEIFSSWFLLNEETQRAIDQDLAHRKFAHPYGAARIDHPKVPEGAVAYYETDVMDRFQRAGLTDIMIHYGQWRGDRKCRIHQDIVVARVAR